MFRPHKKERPKIENLRSEDLFLNLLTRLNTLNKREEFYDYYFALTVWNSNSLFMG